MSAAGGITLDFEKLVQSVPGLLNSTGTIPAIAAFGDSGDIFNHRPWRLLFDLIGSSETVCTQLVALSTQILLRGRSTKIQNKGRKMVYSIDVSKIEDVVRQKVGIKTNIFQFAVIFGDLNTRVESDDLTPERFKCAMRGTLVSVMMSARRFPATSCSIGFDAMAKGMMSFKAYMEALKEPTDNLPMPADARPEDFGLTEEAVKAWKFAQTRMAEANCSSWFSISAMVSGSISQKEIYQECEDKFPGTVFWAGVHSIMTDVANKRKAPMTTADKRAELENSNFYGDFKKKQSSRGINISCSEAYMMCLDASGKLMSMYLRASTGVSVKEVSIIDMVMKGMEEKTETSVLVLDTRNARGITADTAEDVKKDMYVSTLRALNIKDADKPISDPRK